MGIGKSPVNSSFCGIHNRADLAGTIAERNGQIKMHSGYFIKCLRPMARDIDPDLIHHRYCAGAHVRLAGAGEKVANRSPYLACR